MHAIILANDDTMNVDGIVHPVDCAQLRVENTQAVQWYDTYGEVEFLTVYADVPVLNAETNEPTEVMTQLPYRRQNERITDFTPYQPYFDAWSAQNAKAQRQAAALERIPAVEKQKIIDELNRPAEEAAKLAEHRKVEAWRRLSQDEQRRLLAEAFDHLN